jgi:DNA mismatch endonuclease (patch repair protein)
MARVRDRNTKPELAVRRLLHSLGYRFRLHRDDLPGRPDIVLPRYKKAIFVHGCFWHGHGCRSGQLPKSRLEFWAPKIEENRARDARNFDDLRRAGWSIGVVWECQTRNFALLEDSVRSFLCDSGNSE